MFQQFIYTQDFVASFNLREYAKLQIAMPLLWRSCPSCRTFVRPSKCHGFTCAGKQCSLNPKHVFIGGSHLCGNHFNKENSASVFTDMPLACEQLDTTIQAPDNIYFEFPPNVLQHLDAYGKIADELLPWNDSIKQMAKQYHELSMACQKHMPAHMFSHDISLGCIGCDVSVALRFLISLRC